MTKLIIIPRLGELLRTIITYAGYRGLIKEVGLDKDLDDLAGETREGSSCDLMMKIEEVCQKELALECGIEWAQFFGLVWMKTREAIQQLAREVDTSPLADKQGQEEVLHLFGVPMFSEFLRLVNLQFPGPVADECLKSPVATWVQWASTKIGVGEDLLLANLANHLEVDQRSIERWMAGKPLQKLHWPYREVVAASLGSGTAQSINTKELDQLTGWLIVAVAFQSLPPGLRDRIRRNLNLRTQQPWSLEHDIYELNSQVFKGGNRAVRASTTQLIKQIEQMFLTQPRNHTAIHKSLADFQRLIDQESAFWKRSYQFIHDGYAASLAAHTGNEAEALRLYETAVDGAWWYAGPYQHPILNEALLYAVGTGKKVAAEHYWDKTFLLGLNNWPKRPLDEQERRRLSFGFEQKFSPQKAKDRIPPNVETMVRKGEFEWSSQALENPNRKVKFAEGRTRRTPLMDAISEGTLYDVKLLVAAGGDPNDFIKESGEGPLSYAMRRACDRKDSAIMEYLLNLDLLPETVNRQASTRRETPLKIAIEMADANAVDRLIKLGADIKEACDLQPSALWYAMQLLHGSIHRADSTQEQAYFAGKGRADVYDAKAGAVLDADLAARRQKQLALRQASPQNQQLWNAVMDYYIRPAEDHRQVIHVLLHHKADANRSFKVEAHLLAEWTPTLFAAQIGDLGVFKELIEYGGNPDLTLMQSSSLERYDALWVAVDHGRHSIVNYLTERNRPRNL